MTQTTDYIAFSIPTGIGAQTGGFAGDAGAVAREFSKHFKLIVNPNAVNAGVLSAMNDNMLYTEGFMLDGLLAGEFELSLPQKNKIGVIFDRAIPQNILNVHINTINAAKTVWGIDILGYELTKEPVGVGFKVENGISSGSVQNPKTLLDAGKSLMKQGVNALAVVCLFDELDERSDAVYSSGIGIDPIGGVEAVISHYLIRELSIPAAHSPAFSTIDISENIVSAKASAEYISSTYLPCVLMGLDKAPQIGSEISCKDVKALVVPQGALGSKGVLGALKNGITVCAVKNPAEIDVTCQKLGLDGIMEFENYGVCLDFLRGEFEGYE